MRRPSLLASVVLIAVALGFMPGAAQAQTEIITYSPFDAQGKVLGSLTLKKRRGECFSSSFKVHRPKVVRCTTGSRLLDPCFKSPRVPQLLICVNSPLQTRGVALRARLPQKRSVLKGPPWALRISGYECDFASGATNSGPHGRLNYSCGPGLYLFGDPITTGPTWQIWMGREPTGSDAQLVDVITAWL